MTTTCQSLQLGLEDLLGDLTYARRTGDLGRMALLGYCEVRRWARLAGEQALAEQSSRLINNRPHPNRDAFIADVDQLILGLEQARARVSDVAPSLCRVDLADDPGAALLCQGAQNLALAESPNL